MISLNKLRVIAKAKFSDKKNLGEWYKIRLDICRECPYNTSVKEKLTLKDKAILAVNLGKPACTVCGCEIKAKASVRGESCGLAQVNIEPLWGPLPEVKAYDINNLKIENLSGDKIKVIPASILIFDYGKMEHMQNTEISISVEGAKSKISNVKLRTSCGCTVAVAEAVGSKYFIKIEYDSKRIGKFSKTVKIDFTIKGRRQTLSARIVGTIKTKI